MNDYTDIEFLKALRAAGVKALDAGEWSVEFHPEAPSIQPQSLSVDGGLKCLCGHLDAEHNDQGLCLQGCSAGLCSESKE